MIRPAMLLVAALAFAGCGKQEDEKPAASSDNKPAVAPVQKARVVGGSGAAADPAAMPAGHPPAGAQMPAGHPPMGGQAMPAGHPPAGAQMPAGHPPMGGQAMPAGHPPMGGQAMPAGHPPMGGGGAAAGGGRIEGTITLAPDVQDGAKAGAQLFLIARQDVGEGVKGPPLAVKKIPVTGPQMFPLKYELTGGDLMMAGTQLQGNVRLEARIDQDGDAISKTPGDVVGSAAGAKPVGGAPIDFSLNQKL